MNSEKIHNGREISNKFVLTILSLFIIYGGWLRVRSILFETSFWNDESHAALFSLGIFQNGFPSSPIGVSMGIYQSALYYITALSFKIFGITEFAGRLPSVAAGTALIWVIFFVAKRLIGGWGALIATFLMAFSQIQLAWSTQLRPYIWMEFFSLFVIYFSYQTLKDKKRIIDRNILIAGATSFISLFFHGTGIYNFVIFGSAFLYKIIIARSYKYVFMIIGFALVAVSVLSFTPFFTPTFLFRFNTYLTHYQIFFSHHYGWLILGSIIGFYFLYKNKKRELVFLLAGSILFIITFSLFKVHARYVRYSITAFPLLYILLSAGVVGTIDTLAKRIPVKLNNTLATIFVLTIFFAFPLYKGKMILLPQKYYSINADMRENPIVDYKGAFSKIETLIEGKEDKVVVMDAWNDRVPWYLPRQQYVFLINRDNGQIDPFYGIQKIGTIDLFEQVKSQYPAGIVIVENWQSQTPPELQDHVRSTLKFEFTQETVPGNENDPWSISVYSWGLD